MRLFLFHHQPARPGASQMLSGRTTLLLEIIRLIREAAKNDVRWILISTSMMITHDMTDLLFNTTDIETSMRQ